MLLEPKHQHAVIASPGLPSGAIRSGKCLAAMTFFSSLRAKRGNLGCAIRYGFYRTFRASPTISNWDFLSSPGLPSGAIRSGKCLAAMTYFSSLRAKRGNLGCAISLTLRPARAAPPTQARTRPCASVLVRARPCVRPYSSVCASVLVRARPCASVCVRVPPRRLTFLAAKPSTLRYSPQTSSSERYRDCSAMTA